MAKNTLSKGGPGGGPGSKVNKSVGNIPGKPAQKISPGGVGQLGSMQGDHVSDGPRTTTNYRGDKMVAGDLVRPGQPRMGNEDAFTTKAGPGGSREVMKSGSQGQHGPVAGTPWTPGRGFDDRGR
jgi:hypothetical protein